MSAFPPPNNHGYDEIAVGMKVAHDYAITPAVYENFLAAFQDHSPVHVDEAYAKQSGFPGKVMHGAILNGFVSHFVGMIFPGKPSLLLAVDLRYAQPSFLGDALQLEATVSQKLDAQRVVVLDLAFKNLTQKHLAARGRVQVKLRGQS
jgi:3-hydroxybutyryl-CoA dehydratase